MTERQPFLGKTAHTAAFAFREYFRPLVITAGFLRWVWQAYREV
jgi:hypothetical protein